MAELGRGVVDIDVDRGVGLADRAPTTDPTLVVGRRAGVPVGSRLFLGPPPRGREQLVEQLLMRPDDPPGPSGGRIAVTVAVCTRDRPDLLARCLLAVTVAGAFARDEVDLDMVVVDNGSADERTGEVAAGAGARCVREPIAGLDLARNCAVRESRGEVIAFVDDDVVVDETWLQTLARTFAAHPDRPAVSGQVLAFSLDTTARVEFERTTGFALGWNPTVFTESLGPEMPFRSGIGVGCNMAFRRRALDAVGPFDEALDTGRPLPGGGDLDMMIRMVLAGGVVYEPSAVVFHEHRREWAALRYQFYTWGKGWAVVLAKWHRAAPEHRARIRRVAVRTMRSYVAAFVRGPRRPANYRRWHSVLLGIGFTSGWLGAYPRSVARIEARRHRAAAVSAAGG